MGDSGTTLTSEESGGRLFRMSPSFPAGSMLISRCSVGGNLSFSRWQLWSFLPTSDEWRRVVEVNLTEFSAFSGWQRCRFALIDDPLTDRWVLRGLSAPFHSDARLLDRVFQAEQPGLVVGPWHPGGEPGGFRKQPARRRRRGVGSRRGRRTVGGWRTLQSGQIVGHELQPAKRRFRRFRHGSFRQKSSAGSSTYSSTRRTLPEKRIWFNWIYFHFVLNFCKNFKKNFCPKRPSPLRCVPGRRLQFFLFLDWPALQVSSVSLPEIRDLNRRKTAIEEQFERSGTFELTSVEQETYERYFYGTEHWNYFTNDEDLGPVVLSLKQEIINGRDQFRYFHSAQVDWGTSLTLLHAGFWCGPSVTRCTAWSRPRASSPTDTTARRWSDPWARRLTWTHRWCWASCRILRRSCSNWTRCWAVCCLTCATCGLWEGLNRLPSGRLS